MDSCDVRSAKQPHQVVFRAGLHEVHRCVASRLAAAHDDDSFALRHQLLKELRLELAAMVDVALEGLLSREVDHSWHRARPGIHHQVERPFLDQLTRGFVDGVDGRRPGVRGVVYLGDSGTERKLVL